MLDFCVIGSGVSGSTISYLLSKKYSVHILDKARGPGGRASNKRFKQNLSFDHGVQYISPKSKEFLKFIKTLCKKKEAKIWTGNHLDFTFEKKEISQKFYFSLSSEGSLETPTMAGLNSLSCSFHPGCNTSIIVPGSTSSVSFSNIA